VHDREQPTPVREAQSRALSRRTTSTAYVAVWVGYDNADSKRRTRGGGATGGGVAVPIFDPVIRAVWNGVAPRTALAPPSPEAKRELSCAPVDADSGEVRRRGTRTTSECLRIDNKGKIIDTTMALLEPGGSRHAKKSKKRDDEEAPRKKTASLGGIADTPASAAPKAVAGAGRSVASVIPRSCYVDSLSRSGCMGTAQSRRLRLLRCSLLLAGGQISMCPPVGMMSKVARHHLFQDDDESFH
jgi:hypothetical protein